MHEPLSDNDSQVVPPERALEQLPVEEAWHLLGTLSSRVTGKQTELQVMVGSRYHELIESADSIVSMKQTSEEVLELLRDFPQACSSVTLQVPPSSSERDTNNNLQAGQDVRARTQEVVQLMLHAPSAIWAALDSDRVLEAANTLLRCRESWARISSLSAEVDSSLAAFLRSHVTYVEQFPRRIVLAGTRLLGRCCGVEETAGALAALLQLHAVKTAQPLRCVLELLLRKRGSAVLSQLSRATKGRRTPDIQAVLRNVVTIVQKTIVDVHAVFARRMDGSCKLSDLVHQSLAKADEPALSAREAQSLCTKWLRMMTPRIRAVSKELLSAVSDTSSLAQIRRTLWELTHESTFGVTSAQGVRPGLRDEGATRMSWAEAATFAIDASSLDDNIRTGGCTKPTKHVDLWSLLFSGIFAELAENMLKESLSCIRQAVERRLDVILLAITGGHNEGVTSKESKAPASHASPRPVPRLTHDALGAANAVVSLLTSEISMLAEEAWCLTEKGDENGAIALRSSFYNLSVDLATRLVYRLRVALQEIHACIKSGTLQDRIAHPQDVDSRDLEDAMGRFADAGLIIGRVASMLSGRGGRALHSALEPPQCFLRSLTSRIEKQQLEAAFMIADTNGDGVLDSEEAAEAVQAVSFGASAALVLDPSPYTSLTRSEFFLFATRLLEEQLPRVHLASCLESLLSQSLTVWAECSLARPGGILTRACDAFSALCQKPGMTDDELRRTHGIWEDKLIELDRDDGDEIQESLKLPMMISPAILCYVQGMAAELSRILSTADLIQNIPDEARSSPESMTRTSGISEGEDQDASEIGEGAERGAARYARSLAAGRASNDLKEAMAMLCTGPHAAAAQTCEAAQLQLLLDALFLQEWVADPEDAASSMTSIVQSLFDLIDPINLQIYMPHLEQAASACSTTCSMSLSLIFARVGVDSKNVSVAADGTFGTSSSFVPIASRASRFELLPLPLDVVRLQHANGELMRNPKGRKGIRRPGAEEEVPAQARGMEAGRQAFAGFMGQVGNVGNVLSAQNVNVQSVFGAASLFLGGRNRRGDGDDESMWRTGL